MASSDAGLGPDAQRLSGVLLHPTSLPGRGGIGDLGRSARDLLAWLEAGGQSVWQVLPFHQTGYGNSPYGTVSSFAGNRLLIDLTDLVELGLLAPEDLDAAPAADPRRVDYAAAQEWKDAALRRAWGVFAERAGGALKTALGDFDERERGEGWLADWTLYAALKNRFGGASWRDWPDGLRRRLEPELAAARRDERDEIAYQTFVQFLFYRQWESLHAEARRRGLRILGDLPIYPALDSADVWAHQQLFDLDESGALNACAGVPPDYFSADGQRWGNPVYRWERHEASGFAWWIRRLRFLLRHVDELRLDHFRGFVAYWRVPASAETARDGSWVEAPGAALFAAVRRELGNPPLIAEDLGVITPEVVALRRDFGMAGMKVLQFAFDELDGEHLPHHHATDSVVYTGTHDNDTTRGWYAGLEADSRRRLADYLGTGGEEIHWDLIRAAQASVGRLAMAPAQDVLGLDGWARMNSPGASGGNWLWRLEDGELGAGCAERLRRLTTICGRLPEAGESGDEAAPNPDRPAAD